ncbi:uncharacterized protein LOC131439351 [Malaya genurostris]|uniref:uncharacterized protein LOC131439351 n=1 Tax=Malaya genurostris TaxID=325434 RepID=UPI0026F3858D|nr:uncharacterized protein LOC131439351 [Malaya genurostris]
MKRALRKTLIAFVPVIAHACSLNIVDHFGRNAETSKVLQPDVASLMFVTATSIIFATWLGNTIETKTSRDFLLTTFGIFWNAASCELLLRLLWIPIQYFIRYLKDKKILAIIVRTAFCYLQTFEKTRKWLSNMTQISQEETAFILVRNVIAALYLLGTLYKLHYLSKLKTLRVPRKSAQVMGLHSTQLE